MRPTRGSGFGLCVAAGLVALALLGVASARPKPAKPSLAAPAPLSPASGVATDGVPAFAWKAVKDADQYEFQVAADAGFNSPVLGHGQDDFLTKNTRATLKKTLPNGTYWWRVRAISATGGSSAWSQGRSIKKLWARTSTLLSPVDGAAVVYPTMPLKLSWTPVPGARKYLVSIAYDPGLGSMVPGMSPSGGPAETTATTFTRAAALAPGTYYWGITPVDAEGNRGVRSQVASFTWTWPSQTTARVVNLSPNPDVVFDPQFSWDRVRGAARYEVEVNTSQDFAPGSKVCLTHVPLPCTTTTIATSLSPVVLLKDNRYYWRVRALDVDGNAGAWNLGPTFTKTFDNVPPVSGTSIKNLHMRDNVTNDPVAADSDHNLADGFQGTVPVVSWDPVPGASSYQVQVAPWASGGCQWAALPKYVKKTSVTSWTPFSTTSANPIVYAGLSTDFPEIEPGSSYCVSVQARSDRVGLDEVLGDPTYLQNGNVDSAAPAGPAFTWTNYPTGSSARCSSNYLTGSDYVEPAGGATVRMTPLLTWKPLRNCAWVILKNTFGVDALMLEARSEMPTGMTYAVTVQNDPSDSSKDDLILYDNHVQVESYQYTDGNLAGLAAQLASSTRIQAKVLVPAAPLQAVSLKPFNAAVTSYFVVVAKDPSFSNVVDEGFTNVPAYAPRNLLRPTTYSDETTSYYWAVLPSNRGDGSSALALDPVGSAPSSFQKQSNPPALLAPANGIVFSGPPTFRWTPALGAKNYRLQISQDPSFGTPLDDVTTDSTAYTSDTTYPGDTVLYWRVRADDENGIGLTWSATGTFQKSLPIPQLSAENPAGGDFIPTWSWAPVDGAVAYDVSADLPDGTHRDISGLRTPVLTPVLMYGTGVFSWRVRAEFPKSPVGTTPGPYTATHTFVRSIGEPTGAQTDAAADHILLSWNPKPQVRGYQVQLSAQPSFVQPLETVITDNTSYAPSLKWIAQPGLDTGRIYWRVAAIDEGNNIGDFTPVQLISRTRRMQIVVHGSLRRRRLSLLMITVKNFESGAGVNGIPVRVSGAGLRARRYRTSLGGMVTLRLRPRSRRSLLIRASAAGYQAAAATVRVR